ncbi:hydrogenase subunit beta [bacterium]|jgi:formate hydrogenlyase subunit 6/NADH:ubiquinone oxidoreductase subunit I|nr:hydrogenase subunit beta [bacterium]
MEATRKLIRRQSLEKLYNALSETRKIYAPVLAEDKQITYCYNPSFAEVTFDHIRSTMSPKNVLFPKVENLFYYTNEKTESVISVLDLNKIPEVVLWGAHPCDTAAIDVLRSIFCWDIKDEFFAKRLEKLVVIGLSCHQSDEYCFCTSTGIAPDSKNGSDILLSRLQGGDYQAEILTEKGQSIVDSSPELFEPVTGEQVVITEVKQKFDNRQVTEKLATGFEHPFWVSNSLRCIGCGACAYLCPTCACFDIQDETTGKKGRRYRSWDSCGFGLFTLHTSGHNPRSVQSQRWRQRIMHKFSYMPERNESLGCVGCGRCSSGCPVDMNIAEQLAALQNI